MIYILYDKKKIHHKSEINVSGYIPPETFIDDVKHTQNHDLITHEKGYFLFDTEKHRNYTLSINLINIDGEHYQVEDELSFTDMTKARAKFLILKIAEFKKTSLDKHLPTTYHEYLVEHNLLLLEYPEYFV